MTGSVTGGDSFQCRTIVDWLAVAGGPLGLGACLGGKFLSSPQSLPFPANSLTPFKIQLRPKCPVCGVRVCPPSLATPPRCTRMLATVGRTRAATDETVAEYESSASSSVAGSLVAIGAYIITQQNTGQT